MQSYLGRAYWIKHFYHGKLTCGYKKYLYLMVVGMTFFSTKFINFKTHNASLYLQQYHFKITHCWIWPTFALCRSQEKSMAIPFGLHRK